MAGLATIALFAVVVLFSVYVFWQAETVSPGFPTELVISLLLIVAWLVAALASVKTSYDLLYNQRDYLLLRTAPIPTRTVLSVRLGEIWVRSGALLTLIVVAVTFGWAMLTDAAPAVMSAALILALCTTLSGCCLGTAFTLTALAAVGRRRFEQFMGSASMLILTGVVLLQPAAAPGAEATAQSTAAAQQTAASFLRGTQLPFLPSSWAADALRAMRSGEALPAVLAMAAYLVVCIFIVGVLVLLFERLYQRTMLADAPATTVRRGPVTRAFVRALSIPGVVGAVALREIRTTFRDSEQRARLLLLPLLIPVYIIRIPEIVGARDVQALTSGPALGVAFGLLAGLSAANTMSLRSFSLSGPSSWFLGTAPVRRSGVVLGKFLGAYLAFAALALPTTAVVGIALRHSPSVLGANLLVDLVAGTVMVTVGMFFGGLLRRSSAVESTAVPRPSLAAGLSTLGVQSVLLVAAVIAASTGQLAWLALGSLLLAAVGLVVTQVFVEGAR